MYEAQRVRSRPSKLVSLTNLKESMRTQVVKECFASTGHELQRRLKLAGSWTVSSLASSSSANAPNGSGRLSPMSAFP